jgi:hypothetical protein
MRQCPPAGSPGYVCKSSQNQLNDVAGSAAFVDYLCVPLGIIITFLPAKVKNYVVKKQHRIF